MVFSKLYLTGIGISMHINNKTYPLWTNERMDLHYSQKIFALKQGQIGFKGDSKYFMKGRLKKYPMNEQ